MFFFGLFTSHIPYIFFSLIYLVFFGVPKLQQLHQAATLSSAEGKHIFKSDNQLKKVDVSADSYVVLAHDFITADIPAEIDHPPKLYILLPVPIYPERSDHQISIWFSVFSRPPPGRIT